MIRDKELKVSVVGFKIEPYIPVRNHTYLEYVDRMKGVW